MNKNKSRGCILGLMTKLIALYFYVEERYGKDWKYYNERFSNNDQPAFTDEEVLTVYLYGIMEERRFRIKEIYDFTRKHLLSWFPKLPTYQAFNDRLNRLGVVFQKMLAEVLSFRASGVKDRNCNVVDSLPVIICSGKRRSKVATEISDKGYCSTKSMYYYGLKIHVNGIVQQATTPLPESIVITAASENDLNVFRNYWHDTENKIFVGDKIYKDDNWFELFERQNNSIMLTPVKAVKGMSERIRQFHKAADDLWSKAVSGVRQPIESLFNWLIEKTDLQRASKVRSTKGLLVHVYGKMAAAFLSQTIF